MNTTDVFSEQNDLKEDQDIQEELEDESHSNINLPIQKLVENYIDEIITTEKNFVPIRVDEIVSRFARFYETIRKIIDWKDDNVLRRGAIERILKRILFPKLTGISVQDIKTEKVAETLTVELIRGGHLPNDAIPIDRINAVSLAMEKYVYFLRHVSNYKRLEVKKRINFTSFVLEIASCEFEEILTNPVKEYGLIETMTDLVEERVSVVPEKDMTPEDKRKFIFIAVCRALYGLDDNFISYQLLQQKYPEWQNPDEDEVRKIAEELPVVWKEISEELKSRVIGKFEVIAEQVDTTFVLIGDILEKLKDDPEKIVETIKDKSSFVSELKKVYEKRYKTLKTRLFRLAIFSTLSVFLSNWFLFFIVEVPLARLFYDGFSITAAIVDLLLPTAVMFFLVIIIKPPKKDNLDKVVDLSLSFVYKDVDYRNYRVELKKHRPSLFRLILSALYIYTMLLFFAAIGWIFHTFELPLTSVMLNTFTIALTVFAALTIKNKSKELSVDEQMSVSDFILDIFSVPVAKVGSLFAAKWREYNVIAVLFNFVIETPFAIILNFIQEWREFIKERRAEIH